MSPQYTGVLFTNACPPERHVTNTILPNGSGVATGDIDQDGRCDVFFAGLGGGSRLYRNLGDWRFEDVTAVAGVSLRELDATGAAFADIDGDKDLDLIVNTIGGGTMVFVGDGQGRFVRRAEVMNANRGGMSLALADADGDGDLDLYVANYRVTTLMDSPGTRFSARMVDGKPQVTMVDGRPLTDREWTNRFRFTIETGEGGRVKFAHEELGEADVLYMNDGRGQFSAVSWTGGAFLDDEGKPLAEPLWDWGLSVTFRDLTGDGSPDLYVCNDFRTPDRYWINDGKGKFRAAPRPTLRQQCLSAMAMDVSDVDRDGDDDFLVVDMLSPNHQRRLTQRNMAHADLHESSQITGRPQNPRNMLFLNRGDGTYAEVAQYAGLEATDWSWALAFLDVDLDGDDDLLVPNGFERDNMNVDAQNRINQSRTRGRMPSREELVLRRMFPRLATPNLAFRNLGNLKFEEAGQAWGFATPTISQGLCLADLDNDGDLDVVANNMNSVAGLYRNRGVAPRVAIRLRGAPPNTHGIGARIRVFAGQLPQSREMTCGGRYLSGDDTVRVFAAGPAAGGPIRIDVTWRSGRRSIITNGVANRLYEIDEAGATSLAPAARADLPSPLFVSADDRIRHVHQDEDFDDFIRQPLLPKRLSGLGPGVCWWDVDGDGAEDLIVGSGKGGRLGVFRNEGSGHFREIVREPWNGASTRDGTALVSVRPGIVWVGSASYEEDTADAPSVIQFASEDAASTNGIPGDASSVGPLAMADYTGDGDPDLFVGGRVVPGRYPLAASSRLYRAEAGQWLLDEANSRSLREVGMVSGAVWSDVDGNGSPDLVLACEWGSLRVFLNERGSLQERTKEWGLDRYTGWWNGVTAGDFDGDGKMDLAASNWGQNTQYERYRREPLRLYHGDLDGNGTHELIEAHFEASLGNYVPRRMMDTVVKAIPVLAARYPSHQSWAETSLDVMFGHELKGMANLEANWLESTVFLNRDGRFEARALPKEAQWAPAFAICVGDSDGDGNEDLFLSQNFFAVPWETSRLDAGRGLWLLGDGRGQFRALSGSESGVTVYGEQRGAALSDFDADGRVDLAVAQHGAETRLFRNARGKPGLRVRLRGSGSNPFGIGAMLRIIIGDRPGPAREVRAGGGYWSQDGAIQVLANPGSGARLWVRWPGGKETTVPVPPGALQVTVDIQGGITSP